MLQQNVEGVDYAIVASGEDSSSRWIWHCLRCDAKEYGEWSDPDNARISYDSHDCRPCPVCTTRVRIVGLRSKPANARFISAHRTPLGAQCGASTRPLGDYSG